MIYFSLFFEQSFYLFDWILFCLHLSYSQPYSFTFPFLCFFITYCFGFFLLRIWLSSALCYPLLSCFWIFGICLFPKLFSLIFDIFYSFFSITFFSIFFLNCFLSLFFSFLFYPCWQIFCFCIVYIILFLISCFWQIFLSL